MYTLTSVSYKDLSGRWYEKQTPRAFRGVALSNEIAPVRLPPSYKGQKHFPGYLFFSSLNRLISYESRLEGTILLQLDFNKSIKCVVAQPCVMHYKLEKKRFRHTPDYFIQYDNGSNEIINVKPQRYLTTERNMRAFKACAAAANELGWAYTTRCELDPALLANLRWLSGYRYQPRFLEEYGPLLIERATDAPTIEEIVKAINGYPALIRPVLFHLIWNRILQVDMYKFMTNSTAVFLPRKE